MGTNYYLEKMYQDMQPRPIQRTRRMSMGELCGIS